MIEATATLPRAGSIRLISYLLFLAGFLYYCVLPIVCLSAFPDYSVSQIIFNRYPETYSALYFGLAIIYLVSFSSGYYLGSKNEVVNSKGVGENGIGKLSILVTICYFGVSIFIVNIVEIVSPIGYGGGYDTTHRGQLTTLYLISIWWFIYLKSTIKSNGQARLMLGIIFIAGLNLLTLGSRLGAITGIIALFLFYVSRASRRLRYGGARKRQIIKSAVIIVMIAILMTSIGALRTGGGISWEGVISIFAVEPLFIYASVPAYLSNNSLPLVAVPWDLFTSIAGSIPSFLFPEKLAFFAKYTAINEESIAGFGGINHVVMLIANFGLLGFPAAALVEGAWFGMLIRRFRANAFSRAVAVSSSALLTFILFREGLQTTVKLLFFNFLVMPYIILNTLFLIKWACQADRYIEAKESPIKSTEVNG